MLTAHFSLREMCASGTAIRLGIKNEPSEEVINRLKQLCEHVLEPLRQRFGNSCVSMCWNPYGNASVWSGSPVGTAVTDWIEPWAAWRIRNTGWARLPTSTSRTSRWAVRCSVISKKTWTSTNCSLSGFRRMGRAGCMWVIRTPPPTPPEGGVIRTGGRRLITMWCRHGRKSCSGNINVISTSCVSSFKFHVSCLAGSLESQNEF